MSKSGQLRVALVALLVASGAVLAEKIKPPTIAFGEPTTTIIVADYLEGSAPERLVFSKVEVLQSSGDVPQLIDIAKPDLRKPLVAGGRYVLAYSPYAENRLEQIVVNPRGASFLSSPGIEPGLWKDSREARARVMWRIDSEESEHGREHEVGESSDAARHAMPRLLKMLRSDDSQWREFAAAEIALRPALIARLDGSEQKALQRFVASDAGPDRARASLLQAAAAMPATMEAVNGWDKVATTLMAEMPLQTRDVDRRSALVLAALSYPSARQQDRDGKLQSRWLFSDDMALVEMAATALLDISADVAKSAFDAALADVGLANDNRTVIQGFKQRLENMHAAP